MPPGRGRGRGKAVAPPSVANSSSFGPAIHSITTRTEPPPLFPHISLPDPVDPTSQADVRLLRYAEELNQFMRISPYFLESKEKEFRLERYSDKYLAYLNAQDQRGKIIAIRTDLAFFPDELHAIYNPEKAQKYASQHKKQVKFSFDDALARIETLEKVDDDADPSNQAAEDEDEEIDEEQLDEDEFEDETDYNLSYFDNGEDYGGGGGDYEDADEGPVY